VDFPTDNLDLSPHLLDLEFVDKLDLSAKYDLTGIVNHYGSLEFGHYISIARNPYTGQWFRYDDKNRVALPSDKVPKRNAYILFYQRKDLLEKSVAKIIPSIRSLFPGKPCNLATGGQGYIIGAKVQPNHSVRDVLYVKTDREVIEVDRSDILPDSDSTFCDDALN